MTERPILQTRMPTEQRVVADQKLPGMTPLDGADWITVDDAYSQQLAEKERLLNTQRDAVLRYLPNAANVTDELLQETLSTLSSRHDFMVTKNAITRPDGQVIPLDRNQPLLTLSRLIQEDLCILQKIGEEHVLTAALLCFPASWTLSEKIGKPLTDIHRPVEEYNADIARRVQRLFDGVRVGQPLWRANFLNYADPALFHPRTEAEPRDNDHLHGIFERSERQTILRLPRSKAVVFAIHTTVTRPTN